MTDASHEAPSEGAGEMFGDETAEQIVRRWADWINDVSDDMEQPDWGGKTLNDVLNERDFLIRHLLRARSSAPEAREGEAVAWTWPDELEALAAHKASAGSFLAHNIRTCGSPGEGCDVPLYTHPAAPSADKLRIAVEAIDRAVVVRAFCASDPLSYRLEFSNEEDRLAAADAIDQALAALQQEGRLDA